MAKRTKKTRAIARRADGKPDAEIPEALLHDLRDLIEEARQQVGRTVNSAMVMLDWRVGDRIRREVLAGKRATYGKEIVVTLSRQLVEEYGNSFGEKNLRRMIQFTEVFPDKKIVVSLIRHLSWTHFIALIPIQDPEQREFYAEICRAEGWSVRTLRSKINGMLFERSALSRKPKELVRKELAELRREDKLTPDLVFRDPYFLDFLGLKDTYSERDLENAILRELERFILELGVGFAFVARQKRIVIDDEDYYIDLLFYHRKLRRLVAIDLKLGKFQAAYKGQMELYLRWLDENERQPDEDSPLGLILCADKSEEHIRLLRLDRGHIRVAAYMTELPPKEVLREKLHAALETAKARLVSQ